MIEVIVVFCICIFLGILIGDWIVVGFAKPSFRKQSAKGKYLLETKNRMDIQRSTECSGFSAAHVLRSFGEEADGKELYEKMPGKLKNGAVLPRNLIRGFKKIGYKAYFRSGNPQTLKAELSKGNRVIAFVRTRLGKRYLHYVSIVGYDENEVFIADSMWSLTNCKEEFFNRRLSWEEFKAYWNIREWYLPFYRYTYLVIEGKEKERDEDAIGEKA